MSRRSLSRRETCASRAASRSPCAHVASASACSAAARASSAARLAPPCRSASARASSASSASARARSASCSSAWTCERCCSSCARSAPASARLASSSACDAPLATLSALCACSSCCCIVDCRCLPANACRSSSSRRISLEIAADSSFCRVESGLMHSVSAGIPTGRVSAELSVWHSCSPVSGGACCWRAFVASCAMVSAWCRHCTRASSFSSLAALRVASNS